MCAAFVDGQDLFRFHLTVRVWASGPESPCIWPDYELDRPANALVAGTPGRTLEGIRSYTGVPDPAWGSKELRRHGFWSNRIGRPRSRGRVNSGGQEEGVGTGLAIDLVRAACEQRYEVAIIVSQDWDFGPAVRLAKEIAAEQDRQLSFESSFPAPPPGRSRRGAAGTAWIPIDKATCDR